MAKQQRPLPDDLVVLGKITSVFGVRGWLKVHSYTEQPSQILEYRPWYIGRHGQWQSAELTQGRQQGKTIVVHLAGCDDRTLAESYRDMEIAVSQQVLPELQAGEYYWSDLIGLAVYTEQGECLGKVDHLLETGANDVLVVKDQQKEHLLPYLPEQVIKQIDLKAAKILVDWDTDF